MKEENNIGDVLRGIDKFHSQENSKEALEKTNRLIRQPLPGECNSCLEKLEEAGYTRNYNDDGVVWWTKNFVCRTPDCPRRNLVCVE